MEVQSVKVETRESLLYPGRQEALIIPIGDIQLDPRMPGRKRRSNVRRVKELVEWGVERGAYWHGMGDYVDVASPSNRDAIEGGRFYDTVRDALERASIELLEELIELFAPTAGRWLGVHKGHHLWKFEERPSFMGEGPGGTTDTFFAEKMQARYLGDQALTLVRMDPLSGHHKQGTAKLWSWHGTGSGQTAAAPLSKIEKVSGGINADVYLMGHYHRRAAVPKPFLDIIGGERGGDPTLVHRDRWFVSTGSFLRSYLQGSREGGIAAGSYVEQAGMTPAGLGAMGVWLRPRATDTAFTTVDVDVTSV
jgi:hypothetical protein